MKNYSLYKLLNKNSVKSLFDIFKNEKREVCLVGGCIRDALLGIDAKDIDVAVNIVPDKVISILKNNKIHFEDFAFKYGSITAVIKNQKFQITTLREDINQIGRHTNIIYTEDWRKDAQRRDFTVNAMYLSSDGNLIDYFNGQRDLDENKLQFIDNIEDRLKEDYLRIFRYYRFLGIFEKPQIINGYEEILTKYCKNSFSYLSNHLLRQEILKMFNTSYPLNPFFNIMEDKKKRYWVELTKNHFIDTKYDLGLNRCLNKIDLLMN